MGLCELEQKDDSRGLVHEDDGLVRLVGSKGELGHRLPEDRSEGSRLLLDIKEDGK